MKNKKYSEDLFEFKSNLTPTEIIDRMTNHTLNKKILGMVFTHKDFIGRIKEDSFEIITSSYPLPYGAVCVIKGKIKSESTIRVTTTLHKAFRILFLIWLILITAGCLTTWIIGSQGIAELLVLAIGIPIGAFLFRLSLHGMYVLARNHGLKKLRKTLQVEN